MGPRKRSTSYVQLHILQWHRSRALPGGLHHTGSTVKLVRPRVSTTGSGWHRCYPHDRTPYKPDVQRSHDDTAPWGQGWAETAARDLEVGSVCHNSDNTVSETSSHPGSGYNTDSTLRNSRFSQHNLLSRCPLSVIMDAGPEVQPRSAGGVNSAVPYPSLVQYASSTEVPGSPLQVLVMAGLE